MHIRVRLTALVLLSLSVPALSFAGNYSITDLGSGGADLSMPMSINNSGQAVAKFYSDTYLYSGGSLTLVPGLGSSPTYGYDLRNDGTIVGSATTASNQTRAFRSLNGVTTQLSTLEKDSAALAINASGQIVGQSSKRVGGQFGIDVNRAVVWNGNTITELATMGGTFGNSVANGINTSGVVVGATQTTSDFWSGRGAIWTNGSLSLVPLLSASYNRSTALGILDDGTVLVNHAIGTTGVGSRATLLKNGIYTDLGDLGDGGAGASKMNALGDVIGTSHRANGDFASFLWTSTSGMIDLSAKVVGSEWSSFQAWDINDSGQIIGVARSVNSGEYRALILTPQAVPEPASMVALGLGAAALLRRRRK